MADLVHIVIPATAAQQLDRLVAQALTTGDRPAGRRPNRGSVVQALIDAAVSAQTPGAGESETR